MKKIIYFILCLAVIFLIVSFIYKGNQKSQTHVLNYKKSEIISLDDYLRDNNSSKNSEVLKINEKGDVTYNGKVVVTSNGKTINENSISESYLWLKIYLVANNAEPKEGCDVTDYAENGIYGLGCYIYGEE